LLKACVLAVQYEMGERALALTINQPTIVARDLLRAHRQTYRRFWQWSDAAVDSAVLSRRIFTVFGWQLHVTAVTKRRTLRNFPMQANGAEMLRLACCLATERGVEVCAPIHDAVLIVAALDRLEQDIDVMRNAMAEASRAVLAGFELGVDAEIIRWPNRYSPERGAVMWDRVMKLAMPNAERISA
jgi:DNA polymerase I